MSVTFLFEPADGVIRYALSAIKGMGGQAAEAIVAARGEEPFRDLADFARRIDPKLVNRRALETLVSAGALDDICAERSTAFASVEAVLAMAQANESDRLSGQENMFAAGSAEPAAPIRAPKVPAFLSASSNGLEVHWKS